MAKFDIPILNSGSVRLRPLQKEDLPLTLAWRNLAHIRRWFIYSEVIAPEQHAAWFEKYQQRDTDVVFIIEETAELGRAVGQVSLYDIDLAQRRAEYGRLMIGDSAARGKGLAKIATRMILAYGFHQLHLEEIYLEVFKDNEAARRVYESLGFRVTGERENLLQMSLAAQNFEAGGSYGL